MAMRRTDLHSSLWASCDELRGDQAREAQVLNALFPLLGGDRGATVALFELIKNQPGY